MVEFRRLPQESADFAFLKQAATLKKRWVFPSVAGGALPPAQGTWRRKCRCRTDRGPAGSPSWSVSGSFSVPRPSRRGGAPGCRASGAPFWCSRCPMAWVLRRSQRRSSGDLQAAPGGCHVLFAPT